LGEKIESALMAPSELGRAGAEVTGRLFFYPQPDDKLRRLNHIEPLAASAQIF
jgi:hypothetical protein